MERERWRLLCRVVAEVARAFVDDPAYAHSTRTIVLVHLWSAAHDRPTSWACRREHWRGAPTPAPKALPDPSTMSRRMRRRDFERFLLRVGERLDALGQAPPPALLRRIDGKPMEVPRHSTDRGSAIGRGVGGMSRGYKLHAVWSDRPMPDAFAVTAPTCARRRSRGGCCNAWATPTATSWPTPGTTPACCTTGPCTRGCRWVCPRNKPGTGLGHHYQSPGRLRSMQMPEGPTLNRFGRELYARRTDIERRFAHLVGFGGGLAHLPPWVRRPWRVRRWVIAKLLINAARIVLLQRRERPDA